MSRPADRFAAALRVQESLRRLAALDTRAAIVAAAPLEICRAGGFSRCLLSRVRGSLWIPDVLHAEAPTEHFLEFVRTAEIPLEHMLLETEMVRRLRPGLVTDAWGEDHTYKAIISASDADAYTAAPLLVGRRTIGFLHCDRLGQQETVTEDDRDTLFHFALELALLLEHATYAERLEALEAEARDAFERSLRDLAEPASVDLGGGAPTSRLLLALSPREREVLDLLATGATNARIADALTVGETTVKSHVAAILRKLRVRSRSEAVARVLHATVAS